MLRSLVNSVMGARGGAARRPVGGRPAAGPSARPAAGGMGGQSAQDAAIGRGVRKLFRRVR